MKKMMYPEYGKCVGGKTLCSEHPQQTPKEKEEENRLMEEWIQKEIDETHIESIIVCMPIYRIIKACEKNHHWSTIFITPDTEIENGYIRNALVEELIKLPERFKFHIDVRKYGKYYVVCAIGNLPYGTFTWETFLTNFIFYGTYNGTFSAPKETE